MQKSPRFKNDVGVAQIAIGAREFECIGASPPHDHPHVYLDMGHDLQIKCPYCGTLYVYQPDLQPHVAHPEGCAA